MLIEALQSIGGNAPDALGRAGLSDAWQQIDAGDPVDIPRVSFARLAQECILALHYHACHRDALPPMPVDNFRLLCIAMLACPNLRAALEIAGQFQDLALGERGRLEVRLDGDQATILLDTEVAGRQVGDMLVTMYGLAAYHRLCSWLIHDEIILTNATLAYPSTNERQVFNILLDTEPKFDEHFNSITFPAAYLDRPIARNYRELSDLFELFPFDILPPYHDDRPLAEHIRDATKLALACNERPPNLDQLADMFGLSTPTFRRRMAEEAVSLVAIRTDIRKELAIQLLIQTNMTVEHIAYRVQFTDVATFRRAFRLWTGVPPQSYRATFQRKRG